MKLRNIILIVCTSIGMSSCADFLDKEPFDKLVPTSFFNTEADLLLYTNSFYQDFTPSALSIVQADEMGDFTSKNNSPTFIAGNYSSVDQGKWNFTNLRNVNYFLEKYNNENISLEARNHYAGIARFFRAYFYFTMVKTYGDVPFYSKTMATDDPDLYKGRDSRTLVMDSVLADLDFAIEHIRSKKDNSSSTITKWIALGLKSRICLFEGTFRKYHTQLGLNSSADFWLEESAKAAKEIIDAGQYALNNTGNPSTDYRNLFISENPISAEVMWANVYNNALKRWHEVTWKFNSATYGSRWGLNKQFVNTYLNKDGSRFTDRPNFDEVPFVEEMQQRDPRLAQTIRSLGYKRSDGSAAPPNFGYTFTGYHILKFSLDDKRLDGVTESYNSVSMMRYAEILLNYAEAKSELGEMNSEVWTQTIGALRIRAGINSQEPQIADDYLKSVYFPEISDKYLLEVRRERGVELVYEGFRYDDLLRWRKGKLLEMDWKGIYVPALNTEMDLDGNGTPDVSFVKSIPPKTTPNVSYVVIDGKASILSNGEYGHIIWRADENREFTDKKYFRPISNADIVDNPNLTQNPGWE
ncbi:RagB/SusD family nutrient uptake outer membrane protein [Sphingobacterium litopenaei]|uniref:RagB/SusD family nutrient uptake outer membrane protein n=1 Tax=Sphingobacterium litopenaei TaxID=2763500 RepID=A0ABR7YET4_9SPHI|nr:RagB/SusD family nutrient uptake outer membrane protein [Sphingobacterium litopenaei]MBD1429825.1 RagB/SusD family nutrient uptake outer membrane protein [Sphingobacterium litopenaei]